MGEESRLASSSTRRASLPRSSYAFRVIFLCMKVSHPWEQDRRHHALERLRRRFAPLRPPAELGESGNDEAVNHSASADVISSEHGKTSEPQTDALQSAALQEEAKAQLVHRSRLHTFISARDAV